MSEVLNYKPFDLEERTYEYTKDIITFVNTCPKTTVNSEFTKQLVRASGSVGANYIEAREALSKKDFIMRVKICRKEVKESAYWLRLIELRNDDIEKKRQALINESTELLKIFASIIREGNGKSNEGSTIMKTTFRCQICGAKGDSRCSRNVPFPHCSWYKDDNGLIHGSLYCRSYGTVYDTIGSLITPFKMLLGKMPSKIVTIYEFEKLQQLMESQPSEIPSLNTMNHYIL